MDLRVEAAGRWPAAEVRRPYGIHVGRGGLVFGVGEFAAGGRSSGFSALERADGDAESRASK